MEKNNIIVSKMELKDLDEIKDTLVTDFDNFWNYNILKEEFNSSMSNYLIAKLDNKIVGFSGIKIILAEAELMNIVVKKDCRHNGIASCMLENIIFFCKSNKINVLYLEVNSKNTIAINLYKKYNFNQIGLRKKYYNNIDDAILMSLNINQYFKS